MNLSIGGGLASAPAHPCYGVHVLHSDVALLLVTSDREKAPECVLLVMTVG